MIWLPVILAAWLWLTVAGWLRSQPPPPDPEPRPAGWPLAARAQLRHRHRPGDPGCCLTAAWRDAA